jgi:hypothetical protein
MDNNGWFAAGDFVKILQNGDLELIGTTENYNSENDRTTNWERFYDIDGIFYHIVVFITIILIFKRYSPS